MRDPSAERPELNRAISERAALAFLADIGFELAPRLIAAEPSGAFLIMEDLAPRVSLAELVKRDGTAIPTEALTAYARTLGELGAATAGKRGPFEAIRASHGWIHSPVWDDDPWLGQDWSQTRAGLAHRGLNMSTSVERDIASALDTLREPGVFVAMSNGDIRVDNFVVDGADGRLVDFEFARFHHALRCCVALLVPDVACINVTHPISVYLEAEYRKALCRGMPEAEDDRRFGAGLASASLIWALVRLTRFERLDARPRTDRSRLQLVATLESAAVVARRHRALTDLAGWADRSASWLRQRWPDTDVDLAVYPAWTVRE